MTLLEAFKYFDIDPILRINNKVNNVEDAIRIENEIKEECEKCFKELSKKLHPDLGGDNDSMSKLIEARKLIKEFTIKFGMEPIYPSITITRTNSFTNSFTYSSIF